MILKVKKKFTFEPQVVILPAPNSQKQKKMEKGVVEIGRDFLADFIGLERGVFYTVKKLLFDPQGVMEAYKAKDTRVCTPFSLIVLVFGFFFFVSLQTGLDSRIFAKAEKIAGKSGIPEIATLTPLVWSNLPFLVSVYVILTCSFLSLFTKKLNLSFYDHVVANLYNSAVIMAMVSFLVSVLPLIDFNGELFNLMMAGMFLATIFVKKIKLRILFYYPENVRDKLKKPMMISGIIMSLLLLAPLFWLIFIGRL
jgi:hypothetical protein